MRNGFPTARIRRPSPAFAVATAALFFAAGGPAHAVDAASAGATLITGKQVKNGTIDSRDVKDKSLTGKDIKDGSITAADLDKKLRLSGALPSQNMPGQSGSNGSNGSNGADGKDGANGVDGKQGPQGERGPQGETGAQGPAGPAGKDGERGPGGIPGEDGAAGPQGPQGPKGDKGDPGTVAPSEAYRIVGDPGQPAFAQDVGFPGYLFWHANDHNVNKVAFYKDGLGVVHLKGKAKCVGTVCNSASLVFQLPAGYRPAQQQIFAGLAGQNNNVAGTATRINVEPTGWVSKAPTAMDSQNGWVSFDGITFRAEQ